MNESVPPPSNDCHDDCHDDCRDDCCDNSSDDCRNDCSNDCRNDRRNDCHNDRRNDCHNDRPDNRSANDPNDAPHRNHRLVLASASPRRLELLEILLTDFDVCPSDIDESVLPGEPPSDYVCRMARQKAEAFDRRGRAGSWVLGSDTSVVVDSIVLGKPAGADEARSMLRQLSGRSHAVHSAVALRAPDDGMGVAESVTRVTFETLPAEWIDWYVATGDPMDKAGAYAIQGAAAAWIGDLQGSYSGVVGLPLFETAGLLRRAGLLDYQG